MCSSFTVLADGVVQVVVALGEPAALTAPAQVVPQQSLVFSSMQPCPAVPSHGLTSQLILVPSPGRWPGLGVPWCPVAALPVAGVVGWVHTDPRAGTALLLFPATSCLSSGVIWGSTPIFPLKAMNSNFSGKKLLPSVSSASTESFEDTAENIFQFCLTGTFYHLRHMLAVCVM